MNRFYVIENKRTIEPMARHLNACLDLVSHAPTHILSVDLEAWRNTANHLDVFTLNTHLHVLCLDLEKLIP